jgi:hypothetical protein
MMDGKFNPNLDEATAVQLVAMIDNQINALTVWKRKLTQPYLPESTKHTYTYRREPVYPMPNLSAVLSVAKGMATFELTFLNVVMGWVKKVKRHDEA